MTRYDRHRPLLSDHAWDRFIATPVLIAGVGGLGAAVAMHLARLGPLRMELWDPAAVDAPDLNRQILYGWSDLGRSKVAAARARLADINPELDLTAVADFLDFERFLEASGLAASALVIFDCLDSFSARGGLDRIQRRLSCPVFHAGVETWYGQVTTLLPGGGGYARAFGDDFASNSTPRKPILPHVVSMAAAFQVGEFLRWCETPERTPLSDALLLLDARGMSTRRVELGEGARA
ncbi:MAG: HesA/MoeB/ThiF family protein [Spirochaetaceae bacterium]